MVICTLQVPIILFMYLKNKTQFIIEKFLYKYTIINAKIRALNYWVFIIGVSFMHTGFVMVPQMIKSQSTALVIAQDKKLPMVIEKTSTALAKI